MSERLQFSPTVLMKIRYAGETATAVIVANIPHLWPLLSRVFSLGAFKSCSGSPDQYSLHDDDRRFESPIVRLKYNSKGYRSSDSQEKITDGGHEGIAWEQGRRVASPRGNLEDLEVETDYSSKVVDTAGQSNVGFALYNAEAETWQHGRFSSSNKSQIVKTIHIDECASSP